MRTWRIEGVTIFPVDMLFADDMGNLLQQAEKRSRVPQTSGTFGGCQVAVAPTELAAFQSDGLQEPAAAVFVLNADQADQSLIGAATVVIEDFVETMSFQLQQIVPVVQLEALDVTAPVAVGDEREGLLFPYPNGLPLPKFGRSIQMGGIVTQLVPDVAPLEPADARVEAALGWHLKAMTSPFLSEQFMLNWVALEILWRRSGISVETHYTATCGHDIENCPKCGKPTAREVRGASIRKFLTDSAGVDETQAARMWRIRQMFHGDVAFDSKEMDELPALIQVLRAVVVTQLKHVVGIPDDRAPFAAPGNMAIGPQFALGIQRVVTEKDLALIP
jgi:hypothetical protein